MRAFRNGHLFHPTEILRVASNHAFQLRRALCSLTPVARQLTISEPAFFRRPQRHNPGPRHEHRTLRSLPAAVGVAQEGESLAVLRKPRSYEIFRAPQHLLGKGSK